MKKYIPFLIIAIFFASCNNQEQHAAQEETAQNTTQDSLADNEIVLTDAQLKNSAVQIGQISAKSIQQSIRVNGHITVPTANRHTISFPMGGYVRSNNMRTGQFVKKGDVLAVLEDIQYIQLQEDYLIAKTRLTFAEADYIRQETLNKTKSSSDKVFQQAKAEYEGQRVVTEALGQKLRLIGIKPDQLNATNISKSVRLHAPASGYLTLVNANPGKYLSPTDVLFELVNPADMYLSLIVFEKDARHLQPGQKVSWYVNNDPVKSLTSSIKLINKNIDENRSVEIQCDIDKTLTDLLPGTFVNATIHEEGKESPGLPDEAIVRWQNGFYVFIAKDNHHFKMEPVEKGISSDGFTQIHTDLANQNIVTKNAYALLMMLKNKADD
jgi:cobalt-zinc-cadmium efflux system membrane fusion protein